MRWTEPLDEILGSRAKVRVLRCLWRADGEALSGREIARRAGLSHTGVLKALQELEDQDVVWPSSDPTGTRFRLNRTHELMRKGVMPLFRLESSADERLVAVVMEAVPRALSVVLFGSVARGEDEPSSDLDVFIVVPDDVDPIAAADAIDSVGFYARHGKLLAPVVFTRSMLRGAWIDAVPLVDNLLAEGVTLAGDPLRALLPSGGVRAAG